MYIPEKMQVNKFQEVSLPSNKSFFARLGQVSPEALQYTGDELVPEAQRKVDDLADYEAYAEMMSKLSKDE